MDSVIGYYAEFDEWGRLETVEGRLEFERMLDLIDRHVRAGEQLLDLGGGPGRYTLAMAERGYTCQLVDISPTLIDSARDRFQRSAYREHIAPPVVGSATDLSMFGDASFDCVLALGPFYHLTRGDDRDLAVAECFRVLRRGGSLVLGFIPKTVGIAALIDRARQSPQQVDADGFLSAFETGVFENASSVGFQSGYYMPAEDALDLVAGAGFVEAKVFSVKSILYGRESEYREIADTSPRFADAVKSVADRMEARPEVVATCGPATVISRKPSISQ